jgi:hypothetical protein
MKMLSFVLLAYFLFGCEEQIEYPPGYPHVPTIPNDIPSHHCNGKETYWDWKHQRAYNEGRLSVHYDEKGCLSYMVIKNK